ncbi:outer membrane beta-barrel protein, partial [Helicobacter japonicus]|uniref:outer membrane beta-barrel protein n=1 Tax=Helicobacter japonicus TaxID=425400 RepID=UPI0025B2E4B8
YQLVKDKRMYYERGALYPANMYGYECGAAKQEMVESGTKDKLVGAGASYEIIAGYKQFFTPNVGLRYYANFTYANFNNENPGKTTIMNYGVNVDALFNFITSESANFGAFVGVGVGGNTIDSKDLDDIEVLGINLKKTGLDVSLNLGLRSVVDTKHSLEAIARVPLVAMTLFDGNVAGTQAKFTASRNYNIGARYIYNF